MFFFTVISLNSAKFDDVISVLICISSVEFYRVLQYKHFEVWLVLLWFTVLKIMTISLSSTPKLSPCLSSERRHFWSYCRVTKSLPSLFCYATWSSSWKWRETSRTFFAHPISDWTIRTQLKNTQLIQNNDDTLFHRVLSCSNHVLHCLLPDKRGHVYLTEKSTAWLHTYCQWRYKKLYI